MKKKPNSKLKVNIVVTKDIDQVIKTKAEQNSNTKIFVLSESDVKKTREIKISMSEALLQTP